MPLGANGAAVRIDVHAHYFSEEYLDRLDDYGGKQSTLHIRNNKLVAEGSLDAADLWDPLESTCRHASLSIL